MTIYILGMGAVGSLLGAELVKNGYRVVGLCRGPQYETIRSTGLLYKELDGTQQQFSIGKSFDVFNDLNTPESGFQNLNSKDWIIITSKVFSLEPLIVQYQDILSQHGSLVLAQNGIGNEELVQHFIPNIRLYRLLTTNGVLLESPGVIRHTGQGYTKVGYPKSNSLLENEKQSSELAELFNKVPLSAELEPNIDVLLWEKIFVNIGINAIASIYNIPNGGLIETEERKNLMRDAITEAWRVAQAFHIHVDDTPDRYINFTYAVCGKTKPNRNSMLQDLDNGRNTEIDFINGRIVDYGKKSDIKTPVNEMLTKKIKELEPQK